MSSTCIKQICTNQSDIRKHLRNDANTASRGLRSLSPTVDYQASRDKRTVSVCNVRRCRDILLMAFK